MSIKTAIRHIIKCSLDRLDISDESVAIKINAAIKNKSSTKIKIYYTDIALLLASKLNKNPITLAENIINKIEDKDIIKEINVTPPGYIDIILKEEYLFKQINKINKEKANYGKINLGNNQKVNLNFISNSIHDITNIKHSRKIIYEDNLSRILSFTGYDVIKEYFIKNEDTRINNLENSIQKVEHDLDKCRINFNTYISEKYLYDKCLIDEVLSKLQCSPNCYINNGTLHLKTSYKDQMLINEDGHYTPFISTIAYHIDIMNKSYNKLIDIINYDDYEYTSNVSSALTILNKDSSILEIKKVNEIDTSNESDIVTINDLVNEIGINATRYYLSSKPINEVINIDKNLSKSESFENAIYYIEYIYSKIHKTLKEYKKNTKNKEIIDKYITLNNSSAYTMINKLIEFPDIVILSSKKKEPYLITNYLYELAEETYSFYESEIVIEDNERYNIERINLLTSIQIVFENAADLLGIILKEEM